MKTKPATTESTTTSKSITAYKGTLGYARGLKAPSPAGLAGHRRETWLTVHLEWYRKRSLHRLPGLKPIALSPTVYEILGNIFAFLSLSFPSSKMEILPY